MNGAGVRVLKREPLFRIAKRNDIFFLKAWGIRMLAIVLALIINALLIFSITRMNPVNVYVSMFKGVFGEPGNGVAFWEERRFWMMVKLRSLASIRISL